MRNWPFPPTASSMATPLMLVGAAVGAFLLYKLATVGVRGTTAAVTRGVLDAGAGVVVGAGQAVGIPETNRDACIEAIYAGRTWDASFACPASTFIRYLGGSLPPRPGETTETILTTPRDDWAAGLNGMPRRMRRARRSLNRNC